MLNFFSQLIHLNQISIPGKNFDLIEKNAFSNLNNLETLNLSYNRLTKFDRKFIGLGNSVEVRIENNGFNS